MAEQGIHKPLVGGSNPPLATRGSPLNAGFFIPGACKTQNSPSRLPWASERDGSRFPPPPLIAPLLIANDSGAACRSWPGRRRRAIAAINANCPSRQSPTSSRDRP